jgi:hypothetical protein
MPLAPAMRGDASRAGDRTLFVHSDRAQRRSHTLYRVSNVPDAARRRPVCASVRRWRFRAGDVGVSGMSQRKPEYPIQMSTLQIRVGVSSHVPEITRHANRFPRTERSPHSARVQTGATFHHYFARQDSEGAIAPSVVPRSEGKHIRAQPVVARGQRQRVTPPRP